MIEPYTPERDTEELPAASAHEDAFRLANDPPHVMRLSRKSLAALGVIVSLGIGGALIYALQPASHDAPDNLIQTESRSRPDKIVSGPSNYGEIPKLGPPLPGDLGGPIVAAQKNGKEVPLPPIGPEQQPLAPGPRITAEEQARQIAAQERDHARTSQLFQAGAKGSASSSLPLLPAPASNSPDEQNSRQAFPGQRAKDRSESAGRIRAPSSSNILQAGSVIPAALITAIRSDLPGQVTAQVTQNVYDSPTGRFLLIPQGSRLIGEYDSEIVAGQSRVLLAWDWLILPSGRSIMLDRFPGADSAGMAGLSDSTNYHWGAMLKAAFISTLLGAGTELVAGDDGGLARALRFGTQDTVNQTGRKVVERQLSVPPTLTVRAGFGLRVIVTRDLIFDSAATGE